MNEIIDLAEQYLSKVKTGNRYGLLKVKEFVGRNKYGHLSWLCRCTCGSEKIIDGCHLLSGGIRSCGCLQKIRTIQNNKLRAKHNACDSKLYGSWKHMKERCTNKSCRDFKNYGGRGIKLCSEWHDFVLFQKWAMKNGYQEKLTIERIDNDGNYEPANCTWIPRIDQNQNKRTSHFITNNGQTKIISVWAKETGINDSTIHSRIRSGWPEEQLLIPIRR